MSQPPIPDPFAAPPRVDAATRERFAPPANVPAPASAAPPQPAAFPAPFAPVQTPRLLEADHYPEGYSPYISGLVDPNAPGTVFLDVPGAAEPVYIARADTVHPEFWVGTRRVVGGSLPTSKKFSVPLIGGGKTRLYWVENWPGFPDVKVGRERIYRTPGLTGGDRAAMMLVRLAPLTLGLIPGYFAGIGLAIWMASMIKRGASPAQRRSGPIAVALIPVVLLALYIASLALASTR